MTTVQQRSHIVVMYHYTLALNGSVKEPKMSKKQVPQ
jgi:hypothetical protein